MFYIIDHNLNKDIALGFHSHNNLQLSFSNAQELILLNSTRNIILDASVFGMGRGAGNLCTELLIQYINENIIRKYDLMPVLEIIDKYIQHLYTKHSWGYSVNIKRFK
jgi:4-hydroxy 2-oxovalerate aldolase